ncbi:MAG: hypothetical protein JO250_05095 [Armatimonadetes bacterium]|nr:hypothetical protein [Armatimonadota bacterium]
MRLGTAAEGFGMLALWWTLFSLFGVFDFVDGRHWQAPFSEDSALDWVIWGLHILFIACAWHLGRKGAHREHQEQDGPPVEEGVWPPPPRR